MKIAYTIAGFWRGIVIATMLAGTLDILATFLFDILAGGTPLDVLAGIAAAAWPALDAGEVARGAAGLAIHFAIALVMVAGFFAVTALLPALNRHPLRSGTGYGLVLWLVMHWVILAHRFPTMFPLLDLRDVGIQLLCHVLLVGLPIASVAKRATRWRAPRA